MFLKSFDSCEMIYDRGYRGNAGRKISVLYEGEPWMLKFPESTRDFPGRQKPNNHLPSYTTSPVSEYVGSKIYASLGIPVHDVMLGRREGKLVVACRDFAVDATLLEFSQIKNMVDEDLLEGGNGSNEKRELLSNALTVIENAPVFGNIREKVRERFWDMFVTDAFILNNDRNNGNWGLLVKRYALDLAPVYDNGNALFNKRSASLMEARGQDPKTVAGDLKANVSFFLDGQGKPIHPFTFIADMRDAGCNAAVLRFANSLDMSRVDAIIDELPESEFGLTIMPEATKRFYKSLLREAAETKIMPCARLIERYDGDRYPIQENMRLRNAVEAHEKIDEPVDCDLNMEAADARDVSSDRARGIGLSRDDRAR